ncbi:MAG TPA: hypothetical protein VJA21_32980 [Verrucomicrobiae bacterium]
MIVHLRNKESKLYYAGRGRWVGGPPPQLRFNSVAEALLYNRQERLSKMEVVLLHSESGHKVVFPVGLTAVEPEHSNYGTINTLARAA